MPTIVIVGDHDSGKTTFLALLYAAQVKSGSARSDAFRFHAAFESIDEISDAFGQLMSGSFPDAVTKEAIRGITYHLGYRRTGLGLLRRLRSEGWDPSASVTLRFLLMRNIVEEMARYRRGSSFSNTALRDVLESRGVTILVDSTKLGPREEGSPSPMGPYDLAVESLLSAVQRSRGATRAQELDLVFVFSKFDSADPKALRAAGVDDAPPAIGKAGARRAYAEALLDAHLPKTMGRIRMRDPHGLPFGKPAHVFSSVRTEPAVKGRSAKVRLRSASGGGWEPDYSTDEYLALLQHIWEMATRSAA